MALSRDDSQTGQGTMSSRHRRSPVSVKVLPLQLLCSMWDVLAVPDTGEDTLRMLHKEAQGGGNPSQGGGNPSQGGGNPS